MAAPPHWTHMYRIPLTKEMRLVTNMARLTAGLMCPPAIQYSIPSQGTRPLHHKSLALVKQLWLKSSGWKQMNLLACWESAGNKLITILLSLCFSVLGQLYNDHKNWRIVLASSWHRPVQKLFLSCSLEKCFLPCISIWGQNTAGWLDDIVVQSSEPDNHETCKGSQHSSKGVLSTA